MRRVVQVHDHQELVVIRVARLEIGGAGRDVGVTPVGEPQPVHAAGMRPGRVEMGEFARMRRVRHVVDVEPGIGLARLGGLVRHDHGVAAQTERVAADIIRLCRDLRDQGRVFRMGHVQDAHAHGRGLMGKEQYPAAIRILLDRETFAALADTTEVVPAHKLHVQGFGRRFRGADAFWP